MGRVIPRSFVPVRGLLKMQGSLAIVAGLLAILGASAIGQMRWTQSRPASSPGFLSRHSMAYDSDRHVAVLVEPGSHYGQTWEWNGVDWIRRWPNLDPPGGYYVLAYDAARRRTVAFLGTSKPETWEWDGFNWTQRSPKTSPGYRYDCAMAYDAARRRVVLFGGNLGFGLLNDTWEWDGTNWIQASPIQSPPARSGHALAWDAAQRRVVLFGGAAGTPFGDTWVWQGATWLRKSTTIAPPARSGAAMVYDTRRRRVVLFGGTGVTTATLFADTWEWDGTAWTRRNLAASPPARTQAAAAFHAARQRMVMHGGWVSKGMGGPTRDTWEYGGTHLMATGTPRPGRTVNLGLASSLDAGRAYQLASSFLSAPTRIADLLVGLSMDELFWLSATDTWPTVFHRYRGVLDPKGQAGASIAIPGLTALVGQSIHTAFVTIDASAPSPFRSVSNTASFTITP